MAIGVAVAGLPEREKVAGEWAAIGVAIAGVPGREGVGRDEICTAAVTCLLFGSGAVSTLVCVFSPLQFPLTWPQKLFITRNNVF